MLPTMACVSRMSSGVFTAWNETMIPQIRSPGDLGHDWPFPVGEARVAFLKPEAQLPVRGRHVPIAQRRGKGLDIGLGSDRGILLKQELHGRVGNGNGRATVSKTSIPGTLGVAHIRFSVGIKVAQEPLQGTTWGALDSETDATKGVVSAEACRAIGGRRCRRHGCFAWMYDEGERVCHTSPWISVGVESKGNDTI